MAAGGGAGGSHPPPPPPPTITTEGRNRGFTEELSYYDIKGFQVGDRIPHCEPTVRHR